MLSFEDEGDEKVLVPPEPGVCLPREDTNSSSNFKYVFNLAVVKKPVKKV